MNIVRTSLIAEVTVLYYVGQYSSDYTYIYFSPIKIERARAFANWPAPLRNARGSKRTGQARNFISILLFIEREKHYGLTKLEMKTVIDFPSLSGKWADKFFQYDFIVLQKNISFENTVCCHKTNIAAVTFSYLIVYVCYIWNIYWQKKF